MVKGDSEAIKEGECPMCGNRRLFWQGLKVYCDFCGSNLKVEQNQLLEETFEEVTEYGRYEVPLYQPSSTKSISLKWPKYCCICLEPIGEHDFYGVSKAEFVGDHIKTVKLNIPYCKNCRKKVKKLFGRREEEGVWVSPYFEPHVIWDFPKHVGYFDKITLRFRNPVYAKMFRQANKDYIREFRGALPSPGGA